MALLKCPECGESVSDAASMCPHCGFPLSKYIEEMRFNSEVTRLMGKIKPVDFVCPPPRVKVCIKCGKWFSKLGEPLCKCSIGNRHFPGVELDYPLMGYGSALGAERYIHTNCVIPMNIGDTGSEEYQSNEKSLNDRIKRYEEDVKAGKKEPHDWAEPMPPQDEWFGQQPMTQKERDELHDAFTRHTKPAPLIPHCPFCSSTDLTKISNLGKAVKIWAFGLYGMDDAGKTYRCNNCGGKF